MRRLPEACFDVDEPFWCRHTLARAAAQAIANFASLTRRIGLGEAFIRPWAALKAALAPNLQSTRRFTERHGTLHGKQAVISLDKGVKL